MGECTNCRWYYKEKTNMPCLECFGGKDHYQAKNKIEAYSVFVSPNLLPGEKNE